MAAPPFNQIEKTDTDIVCVCVWLWNFHYLFDSMVEMSKMALHQRAVNSLSYKWKMNCLTQICLSFDCVR